MLLFQQFPLCVLCKVYKLQLFCPYTNSLKTTLILLGCGYIYLYGIMEKRMWFYVLCKLQFVPPAVWRGSNCR